MTSLQRLIPKNEIDKLFRTLTNPTAVCQGCKGKVDCIGIEECYPAEDYAVVSFKIDEQPAQAEIVRMVNS